MKGLTRRQAEVLEAIREYSRQHGRPPSLREICAEIGVRSSQTAWAHVRALERKGYVATERYEYRSLRLLDGTDPSDQWEALERVAAAVLARRDGPRLTRLAATARRQGSPRRAPRHRLAAAVPGAGAVKLRGLLLLEH